MKKTEIWTCVLKIGIVGMLLILLYSYKQTPTSMGSIDIASDKVKEAMGFWGLHDPKAPLVYCLHNQSGRVECVFINKNGMEIDIKDYQKRRKYQKEKK